MSFAIRILIVMLSLSTTLAPAFASVEHYFSSIQSDPAKLTLFFKSMPKGGELHYHLAGGASPEAMLSLAPRGHYCFESVSNTIRQFNETPCDDTLLKSLHKHSALYDELLDAWSMKNFIPGKESGHDHFFASFFKFSPIVSQYGAELLAEVMTRAANQNELYMEVMVLPDDAHAASLGSFAASIKDLNQKKERLLSRPEFQTRIQQTRIKSTNLLKKARQHLGCDLSSHIPACALTLKLQYIVLREQPLDQFFAQALNGFAAANLSTDLVGVNLVQAEDGPLSLHDYRRQMRIFEFMHHAYPKVHIALHAGELTPETLGEHETNARFLHYHIHDALLIGHAERIGHGLDIRYEDSANKIVDYMAQHDIPVEISLTSNRKILNVSGKKHPLPYYLAHHVPVVLSTDDEGILRTNLSHEYVNATHQYHLDYNTLKTINRNTLTYSFLPGKSIWANSRKGILVSECTPLQTRQCMSFIKNNEKAALQWRLENQLIAFENQSWPVELIIGN